MSFEFVPHGIAIFGFGIMTGAVGISLVFYFILRYLGKEMFEPKDDEIEYDTRKHIR